MLLTLITPVRRMVARWMYSLHPMWRKKTKVVVAWCAYNSIFFLTRRRREARVKHILETYLNYGFEFNKTFVKEDLDIDKDFFTLWVAERDLYMYNLSLKDRKKYKVPFIRAAWAHDDKGLPLAFVETAPDMHEYFAIFALDFSLDVQYAGRASLIYVAIKRCFLAFVSLIMWSMGYAYFLWRRFVFPALRLSAGLSILGLLVLFLISPLYWCGPGLSWALRRRFGIPVHVSWTHAFWDFCNGPGFILLAALVYLLTGVQISRVRIWSRRNKKGISRIPFLQEVELNLLPIKLGWIKKTTPVWNLIYGIFAFVGQRLWGGCRWVVSGYKENYLLSLVWPAEQGAASSRAHTLFVVGFKLLGTRPWSFLWHLFGRIAYYVAWEAKNIRRFIVPKVGMMHSLIGRVLTGALAVGIWVRDFILEPKDTTLAAIAWPLQKLVSASEFLLTKIRPGDERLTPHSLARFWAHLFATACWFAHYICRLVVDSLWFAIVTATGFYLVIMILGPLGARGFLEWAVIFTLFATGLFLKAVKAYRVAHAKRRRLTCSSRQIRRGSTGKKVGGWVSSVRAGATWLKGWAQLFSDASRSFLQHSARLSRPILTLCQSVKPRRVQSGRSKVALPTVIRYHQQRLGRAAVRVARGWLVRHLLSLAIFVGRLLFEILAATIYPVTAVCHLTRNLSGLLRHTTPQVMASLHRLLPLVQAYIGSTLALAKPGRAMVPLNWFVRSLRPFVAPIVAWLRGIVVAPIKAVDSALAWAMQHTVWRAADLRHLLLRSSHIDQLEDLLLSRQTHPALWYLGRTGWVWRWSSQFYWRLFVRVAKGAFWGVGALVGFGGRATARVIGRVTGRVAGWVGRRWFAFVWSSTIFVLQAAKWLFRAVVAWPLSGLLRLARWGCTSGALLTAITLLCGSLAWAVADQLCLAPTNAKWHIDVTLLIPQMKVLLATGAHALFAAVWLTVGLMVPYVVSKWVTFVGLLTVFWALALVTFIMLLLLTGLTYGAFALTKAVIQKGLNGVAKLLRTAYTAYSKVRIKPRWPIRFKDLLTARSLHHPKGMHQTVGYTAVLAALRVAGLWRFSGNHGWTAFWVEYSNVLTKLAELVVRLTEGLVLSAAAAVPICAMLWVLLILAEGGLRALLAMCLTGSGWLLKATLRLGVFAITRIICPIGRAFWRVASFVGKSIAKLVVACKRLKTATAVILRAAIVNAVTGAVSAMILFTITCFTPSGWGYVYYSARFFARQVRAKLSVRPGNLTTKGLVGLGVACLAPVAMAVWVWARSLNYFLGQVVLPQTRASVRLWFGEGLGAANCRIQLQFLWRKCRFILLDRPYLVGGRCFTGAGLVAMFKFFWHTHCQPHTLLMTLCSIPGTCFKQVLKLLRFYGFVFIFLPFEVFLIGLAKICVFWSKVRTLTIDFYYLPTTTPCGAPGWKCRPFWRLVANHAWLLLFCVMTVAGLAVWLVLGTLRFICTYSFWCLGALFQAIVGALALSTKLLSGLARAPWTVASLARHLLISTSTKAGEVWEAAVFAGWHARIKPRMKTIVHMHVIKGGFSGMRKRTSNVVLKVLYTYRQTVWTHWRTPAHILGHTTSPQLVKEFCRRYRQTVCAEWVVVAYTYVISPIQLAWESGLDACQAGLIGLCRSQERMMQFLAGRASIFSRRLDAKLRGLSKASSRRYVKGRFGEGNLAQPVSTTTTSHPSPDRAIKQMVSVLVAIGLTILVFGIGLPISIWAARAFTYWLDGVEVLLPAAQMIAFAVQKLYVWVTGVIYFISGVVVALWAVPVCTFWVYYCLIYLSTDVSRLRTRLKRRRLERTLRSKKAFYKAAHICHTPVRSAKRLAHQLWGQGIRPAILRVQLAGGLVRAVVAQRVRAYASLSHVRTKLVAVGAAKKLLNFAQHLAAQKGATLQKLKSTILRGRGDAVFVKRGRRKWFANSASWNLATAERWIDAQITSLLPKKLKPQSDINTKELWPEAYKLPKGGRPSHLVLSGFWYKDIRKQFWSEWKREGVVRLFERSVVYWRELPVHFWGPAVVESLFWIVLQLAFPFSFWRVLRRTIRWRLVNFIKRRTTHPTFKRPLSRWWPVSSWAFSRDVLRWYVFWSYNPMHLNLVLPPRMTATYIYPAFRWFCSWFPLGLYDRLALRLRGFLIKHVWEYACRRVAAAAEKYINPLYILVSDYAIKFGLIFEPFNWFVRLRMYSYAYFRLLEYTLRWPFVKPTLQWVALCTGLWVAARWVGKVVTATIRSGLTVGALVCLIIAKTWISFARIFAATIKTPGSMITRQLTKDGLYTRWATQVSAGGQATPASAGAAWFNMLVRLPLLVWPAAKYVLLRALMWLVLFALKAIDHFLLPTRSATYKAEQGAKLRRAKALLTVARRKQHSYSSLGFSLGYGSARGEESSPVATPCAEPDLHRGVVEEDTQRRHDLALTATLERMSGLLGIRPPLQDPRTWVIMSHLAYTPGDTVLVTILAPAAKKISSYFEKDGRKPTKIEAWIARAQRAQYLLCWPLRAVKRVGQALPAKVFHIATMLHTLGQTTSLLATIGRSLGKRRAVEVRADTGRLVSLQRQKWVRGGLVLVDNLLAAMSRTLYTAGRLLAQVTLKLSPKARWACRAGHKYRIGRGPAAANQRAAKSSSSVFLPGLTFLTLPSVRGALLTVILRVSLLVRRTARWLLSALARGCNRLTAVQGATLIVKSLARFFLQAWAGRAHYQRRAAFLLCAAAPTAQALILKLWARMVSFAPVAIPGALDRLVQWLLYSFLRLPLYTVKVWGGNILLLLSGKPLGTKLRLDLHSTAEQVSLALNEAVDLAAKWDANSPQVVARIYNKLRAAPRQVANALTHVVLWAFRWAWGWLDHWFRLESGLAVLLADFKWENHYTPPKKRVPIPAHVRLVLYALWLWWYVPTLLRAVYQHIDFVGAKAHFVKHWRLGCNELWVGVGQGLASTDTYVRLTAPRDYIMATGMREERVHSHYLGARRLLPGFPVTILRHVLVKRWDWRPRTLRFMTLWLLSYIVSFKSTIGRGVGMFAYHASNAVLGFIWLFFARTFAVLFALFFMHMLRVFLTGVETLPHFLIFLPIYAFIIIPPQAAVAVFKRRDPRVWLAVAITIATIFWLWIWFGAGLAEFLYDRRVGLAITRFVIRFCGAYVVSSPALVDACQVGQLAWLGVASIWWYGHLAAPWKGRPLKVLVPVVLLWYFVHFHDYGSDDYDVAAYAYFVLRKFEFLRSGETIVTLMHDVTKSITMPIWYDAYDHEWVRLKLSTYAPFLWMYLFIPFQFQCLFPWFVTHWDPDPITYRRKMSTPFVEIWRPLYTFWLFFFVGYYNLHFLEIASDYDCMLGQISGLGWPYSQGAYKFVNGIERVRAFIEFHDVQMDVPINDLANMTTTVEADWASVWVPPGGWSERLDNFFFHWAWNSEFYTGGGRGPRFGGANVDPFESAEFLYVKPMIFETHLNMRGPSQPMEFQAYKWRLKPVRQLMRELVRDTRVRPVKWKRIPYDRFNSIPYVDFRRLFLPPPHTKIDIKEWAKRPVRFMTQFEPTLINYYHGTFQPIIDLERENWPTLLRTMGLGLSLEEVAAPLIFDRSTFFENQNLPYWDRDKSWIVDMEAITDRYLGPYNILLTYDEYYDVWHEDKVPRWTDHPLFMKQESPFSPWPGALADVFLGHPDPFSKEAFLPLRPHKTWDLKDTNNWFNKRHPAFTRDDSLGDFLYREWTEFGLRHSRLYQFFRLAITPATEPSDRYSRQWYNTYVPPAKYWWRDHHEDGGLSMLPQLRDPALRKAILREWIPRRSRVTGEYEYLTFLPGEEAYPYPPKLMHSQLLHMTRLSLYQASFAHALEPDQVDYRSSVMLFPQVEDTWGQAELHNESPSWEEWSGNPREESAVTWWDAAHGGWETEAFDENPLAFEYALFMHDGSPWHPRRGEFKAVPAISRQSSLKRWLEALTYYKDPWLTLPYRKEYWRVWRWDELEPWEHLDQQKFLWKFLDYIRRWFYPTELVIWVVTGQCYIDTVVFISALYWDYVFLWNDWYKYIFKKHDYKMWLKYLKRHNELL